VALIWLDSCDDTQWFGTGSVIAGRTGNAIDVTSSPTFVIPPAQEADCVTIGFAVRLGALNVNNLVVFKSDLGGQVHVNLQVGVNGSLSVLRSATVIDTSSGRDARSCTIDSVLIDWRSIRPW